VSDAAAGRHGRSRPDACSVLWDDTQGSALGTAPAAMFWLALEQNGPWGSRAASQSHLDPDLGAAVDRMCQDAGGRFILIRRPGTHSEPREGNIQKVLTQKVHTQKVHTQKVHTQRVYLAAGLGGGRARPPWLLQADLDDPRRLTRLPMDSLRNGDIDAVRDVLPELELSPGPVLMICTNSKRDVCCSVRGRPVAIESASQRPGQVWECSHTGGHRFAPTGVLLPHGQALGRLSGTSAVAALDAALRADLPAELLGATHDRGRSHLAAPAQAAESIVRQQIQEPSLLALSTTAIPGPDPESPESRWHCRVSHVDGRHWDVVAVRGPSGDALPQSCGKEPLPRWHWSVVSDYGR